MNNNTINKSFMLRLEEFRLYLIREGNKDSSIRETVKIISRLHQENPDFSLSGFNSFIVKLKEEGRINSYINHFIIAIRHWGKCFNIPELAEMKRIKGNNSSFEKATMSDEEIEEFLALPFIGKSGIYNHNKQLYRKRYDMWTIFFKILSYSGARPMEIFKMKVQDVDFGANVFRVDGKTGKRIVPISFVIRNDVEKYVKALETEELFSMYQTEKKEGAPWRYAFGERIKRMNIKRDNLSVYSLRHSFITRLISQDLSLFKIQKIVGHKRIETTQKYVHVSEKVLQETVEADPLAKRFKSGADILFEFLEKIQELEKNYRDKIVSSIDRSIDGKMTIVLQVKK